MAKEQIIKSLLFTKQEVLDALVKVYIQDVTVEEIDGIALNPFDASFVEVRLKAESTDLIKP